MGCSSKFMIGLIRILENSTLLETSNPRPPIFNSKTALRRVKNWRFMKYTVSPLQLALMSRLSFYAQPILTQFILFDDNYFPKSVWRIILGSVYSFSIVCWAIVWNSVNYSRRSFWYKFVKHQISRFKLDGECHSENNIPCKWKKSFFFAALFSGMNLTLGCLGLFMSTRVNLA